MIVNKDQEFIDELVSKNEKIKEKLLFYTFTNNTFDLSGTEYKINDIIDNFKPDILLKLYNLFNKLSINNRINITVDQYETLFKLSSLIYNYYICNNLLTKTKIII